MMTSGDSLRKVDDDQDIKAVLIEEVAVILSSSSPSTGQSHKPANSSICQSICHVAKMWFKRTMLFDDVIEEVVSTKMKNDPGVK